MKFSETERWLHSCHMTSFRIFPKHDVRARCVECSPIHQLNYRNPFLRDEPSPCGVFYNQDRNKTGSCTKDPNGPVWLTTRTRTRSSGQCVSGATCSATLSFPSRLSPIFHWTKPPYILLQALPEPWRATTDSSASTPNKRDSEYTETHINNIL